MEDHSQPATPDSQLLIPNSPLLTRNPYVGPRAFEAEDCDNFFGRDTEIRQLADLVVAQRAVLLYAPSGAGKPSLINAGLIPTLKSRWVNVLPVARVGGSAPVEAANPFVFNLLSCMGGTVAPEALWNVSLREGLTPVLSPSAGGEPEVQLLVLDQFEELFTLYPGRRMAREDFFAQLQATLKAFPQLGLLLAMREEYLAYLDSYVAMLPDRLRARFRLELLGKEAAQLAIQAPARRQGVDFTDAAAVKLVNDLRQVREQSLDGVAENCIGEYVEPVQLQVVCLQIWEQVIGAADAAASGQPSAAGGQWVAVILESDVAAIADVNAALATYYADTVAGIVGEIAAADTSAERAIREWCERLITPQGLRGIVLREAGQSGGLDNALIKALEDAHLVRAEKRAGTTWYELAHDRLVEPLRTNNDAWFVEHLSLLQRRAKLWDKEKRAAGLLLSGGDWAEAETWVASYDGNLTSTEGDFLVACREAQARARREQQQTRRIRWLAVGMTLAFVVTLLLALFAWGQMREAKNAQATAEARRMEAETARADARASLIMDRARQLSENEPLVSLRLALEALIILPDTGSPNYAAVFNSTRKMAERWEMGNGISNIIFKPDNTLFILVSQTSPGELRRTEDGALVTELTSKVSSISFSPDPDTTYFVVHYSTNMASELRHTTDGGLVTELTTRASSVSFSADSDATYLVVNYLDDISSELRRTSDGGLVTKLTARASSVSFSTDLDATYLVVHYSDDIPSELRRTVAGSLVTELTAKASSVSFSPDPDATYLVVNHSDGSRELRRTADGAVVPLTGTISQVHFSPDPDAPYFVVTYRDGIPAEQRRMTDASLIKQVSSFSGFDITYSPDPDKLYFAVNYHDETPVTVRRSPDNSPLAVFTGTVSSISFSPDTDVTYFLISYTQSRPSELRRIMDGLSISLSGKVSSILFGKTDDSVSIPYFVVNYADGTPSELRRMADGSLVDSLTDQVKSISAEPRSDRTYLMMTYEGGILAAPRRITDGSEVLLTGDIKWASFSLKSFVVSYWGSIPSELRRTADGGLVAKLTARANNVSFSAEPDATCFVVHYSDDIPSELRRTTDGGLVTELAARASSVSFSSDPDATYFVVHYSTDVASELRRTVDGALVAELAAKASSVSFSTVPYATYLVVNYSDDIPSELRRTSDGGLVTELTAKASSVSFSADPDTTYLVVHYSDGIPSELRRTADGGLVTELTAKASSVSYSREAGGRYLIVDNSDGSRELRRIADGAVVPLSGTISQAYFSPDPDAPYFVVTYRDSIPAEQRRMTDASLIKQVGGFYGFSVTYSPDPDKSYFAVNYYDETPVTVRRSLDNTPVAVLTGTVSSLSFSPDLNTTYFVVRYSDGTPTELYRTVDGSLVTLGGRVSNISFSRDQDVTYFIVNYSDGTPSELYHTADGSPVALGDKVSNISFSRDQDALYFMVAYNGEKFGELRRTSDGALLTDLTAEVSSVSYSRDPDVTYLVVNYSDDVPSELHQTVDGGLVTELTARASSVSFSADPDAVYMVVNYSDDIPSELRRTMDGTLVTELTGKVSNVTYSCDPDVTYLAVNYLDDIASELRLTADGALVTELTGKASSVSYSPDPDARYLMVYYSDGTRELRRTADGALITELTAKASSVSFSPDPYATYLVVNYSNSAPSALYHTADGVLITELTAKASSVSYSRDPGATYLVVRYSDDVPSELRRTADGVVVPLSGTISQVHFSPDPDAPYFVLTYQGDVSAEQRGMTDASVIKQVSSFNGFDVTYSSDPDKSYFAVNYHDETPVTVCRSLDNSPVAVFTGTVSSLSFNSDSQSLYLLVEYEDNQGEFWSFQDLPYRLAYLDVNVDKHFLLDDLLIVSDENAAYMFHLNVLKALGDDATAVSSQELVQLVCEQIYPPGEFDETKLAPYLDGDEPRACR